MTLSKRADSVNCQSAMYYRANLHNLTSLLPNWIDHLKDISDTKKVVGKHIFQDSLRGENSVNFPIFGQNREIEFLFWPRKCRIAKIDSREISQNRWIVKINSRQIFENLWTAKIWVSVWYNVSWITSSRAHRLLLVYV